MDIRLPDGTVLRGVPDGTTKADIVAKLQRNGQAVPAEWLADAPKTQASQDVGSMLREVPRQFGLAARAGAKGLMAIPATLVDAATGVVNTVAGTKIPQAQIALDRAMNDIGLPQPRTADERTVSSAVEMGSGAAGLTKAAGKAADMTTGAAQKVFGMMAANPATQIVGGTTSGLAGGSVREAGGGPVEQFIASLAGGVGAGMATQAAAGGVQKAGNAIARLLQKPTVQTQQAEQQIVLAMERSGMDWKAVPDNIKRGLVKEVSDALDTGRPLDADALRRLVVFRQAKVTPTVGQLTQDPGMITREQNLSRTGANSTNASLQRLPQLQNQNVASLLYQLDESGAARAPDAMSAGRSAVGALQGREASAKATIGSLYSQARDTSGRSLPLEGGTFTARANALLDEANVGSFLPQDIANKMNAIAGGKYPLTVEVAEQLKTSIGNIQRGSADGNVRRALGIVRQALDEAPLQGSPQVNPGNLPAVPGTVPPSAQTVGQQSIDAFNKARAANRAWMQRVESNPALQAVVDGVEPDQFVQKFVIGKGASASNVQALRKEMTTEALDSLKLYLVRHLKDKATNSTDDITKFSQDSYRRAIRDIGDDKLAVFFNKEEVQQLKVLGEAAKYMQSQPAGSAVNNSNSGALVLGRGLDWLDKVAERAPFGFRDVIKGTIAGQQQTQVLNPRNALIQLAGPKDRGLPFNPLLAATIPGSVQAREDNRRN
jgi:hypothetical protein